MDPTTRQRCAATTKAGRPCQNYAQANASYCYVHRQSAGAQEGKLGAADAESVRLLLGEIDELIASLREAVPPAQAEPSTPLRFLRALRNTLSEATPAVQSGIMENLKDVSGEDLLDIDTWKGLAYMAAYSARFQAGQVRQQMNERLPEPLQPDRAFNRTRESLSRRTPEAVKQILSTLEGATAEDLVDPDTWKGIWYMINYSVKFELEQIREQLTREPGEAE